ncbi:unnamed protein product [Discula destructiva]
MWDCVLLLDEADLFLAKRDLGDLERNSLVSVFLRVLDYYDGVLFLTTNRVGVVDEAFRSRIHISFYYPTLKQKQTLAIFELNISRIEEIEKSKRALEVTSAGGHSRLPLIEIDRKSIMDFARSFWNRNYENPSRRWNGRQIRNAFQVASSLVTMDQVNRPSGTHYADDEEEDYDDPSDIDEPDIACTPHPTGESPEATAAAHPAKERKPARLDITQFEIVAESIAKFDSYLKDTRGEDSAYAKNKNLRNDDFSDDEYRSPRGGGGGGSSWSRGPRGGRPEPRSLHSGGGWREWPPGAPGSDRLEPRYDHGGAGRNRDQRPRGGGRGVGRDDRDADHRGDETPRRPRGPSPSPSPRDSHRGYDDDYENTYQGRHR